VIENSVIGLRCDVGENVTIRNSVLMGNDYYTALESSNRPKSSEMPPVRIADGCHIEGAIIDKNCCLGRNVRVQIPESMAGVTDRECGPIVIRDGVIVVPRGATLPDNWQLA
jgi:glucose-1-phosphate adenylyltransferase